MTIRNALPFEFPFRWNALRRFFSDLGDEAVDYFDQRDRDLEDFLAGLGGGGGYAATVTVAASNAGESARANCDLLCDGVDDEEQINEAQRICFELAVAGGVNGSDPTAPGGRVLLSEGDFHIGTTGIDEQNPEVGTGGIPNTTLQGQGMSATRLLLATAGRFIESYGRGYRVCDMELDSSASSGGGWVYIQGTHSVVERVRFRGLGQNVSASLEMPGNYARVEACEFFDLQGSLTAGVAIGGNHSRVLGNLLSWTPGAAVSASAASAMVVVCNNIAVDVNADNAATDAIVVPANSIVVGNVVEGSLTPATISSGAGSQVANNVIL